MVEFIIGIILLLSFFGLAYYCIKVHNLMIGFLVITIVWTVLPLVGALFASDEFIAANEVLQYSDKDSLIAILNKIYQ